MIAIEGGRGDGRGGRKRQKNLGIATQNIIYVQCTCVPVVQAQCSGQWRCEWASGPDRQSGLAYDSSAFSTYPCDPGPPPPRRYNNRFKGEKVKIHVAIHVHCHVQSCVHVNDANFGWSFYIHAHMYMYMYHLHVHAKVHELQSCW